MGTPEDGVMTTELLEMLFMGRKIGVAALKDDLVSDAKRVCFFSHFLMFRFYVIYALHVLLHEYCLTGSTDFRRSV